MARAKTSQEPQPEPEPQQEPQCCATCVGWAQRPNWPAIGECMPSRAGGPQPVVTLDWAICSRWKSRNA